MLGASASHQIGFCLFIRFHGQTLSFLPNAYGFKFIFYGVTFSCIASKIMEILRPSWRKLIWEWKCHFWRLRRRNHNEPFFPSRLETLSFICGTRIWKFRARTMWEGRKTYIEKIIIFMVFFLSFFTFLRIYSWNCFLIRSPSTNSNFCFPSDYTSLQ